MGGGGGGRLYKKGKSKEGGEGETKRIPSMLNILKLLTLENRKHCLNSFVWTEDSRRSRCVDRISGLGEAL